MLSIGFWVPIKVAHRMAKEGLFPVRGFSFLLKWRMLFAILQYGKKDWGVFAGDCLILVAGTTNEKSHVSIFFIEGKMK